jgi:hypothetical protein
MSDPARFWAVDFHVHTPGSQDAKVDNFGTPEEIVAAAAAAGLDAIAITDHNTTEWCDRVAHAAAGSSLIVLPGVEISTSEGHLLAIWDEGTSTEVIDELLVTLGIGKKDRGRLDIATANGFADTAKAVSEGGGVAIAAHIDKPKGLMKLEVKAHQKRILLEPSLLAVEVVHDDTIAEVVRKVGSEREMTFVKGSDTWDAAISAHSLSGIGLRRTWIKASRPDLVGVRHAFADPTLRIRLEAPPSPVPYETIDKVTISGGFLDGQSVSLCPDLNCLLGGTGAGKSLILEAIRFALDQQVDQDAFPTINVEVQDRLAYALKSNGVVRVELTADAKRFRVERVLTEPLEPPIVLQHSAGDWVEVDMEPIDLVQLAAFSQGEILEHSREPVGRMSLIDAGIDLSQLEDEIDDLKYRLQDNARELVAARGRVQDLQAEAGKVPRLREQVRELAKLFSSDLVKQQEGWKTEGGRLSVIQQGLDRVKIPRMDLPEPETAEAVEGHAERFSDVRAALKRLHERVDAGRSELEAAVAEAREAVRAVRSAWDTDFGAFTADLDAELEKVDPESTLPALRVQLEALQAKLAAAEASETALTKSAQPALKTAQEERDKLIEELHEIRGKRREHRRTRVAELNAKAAGFVKLDVPNRGDYSDFRRELDSFKVGSRVREAVLDSIARTVHPLRFGRAMWEGKPGDLVDEKEQIDIGSLARLYANIEDRELWEDLLDLQMVDRPDVLSVKFRKPDDGAYTDIENLAHGQRCTAILVILLADGSTPVLVDQPEDALHAPWIEDYLVDRLRALRGTRQYIFATRSPGIVVSADAEQIVTMQATAGKGEVQASGSLERHDLNALTLHHLEGGPIPFGRRTQKLRASVEPPH